MGPQLEKVYDPKNEEDDMMEMEEERLRMREYFMKNVSRPQLLRLASCRRLCWNGPPFCCRWTPTKTAW